MAYQVVVLTSALGVGSVWMNMVRRATVAGTGAALCVHCCTRGLCWSLEDVMGEACLCRHRVATRGVCVRRDGDAFDIRRSAVRGIVVGDMLDVYVWRFRNCEAF